MNENNKKICYTCLANSGEKRISPGPTIYEGKYWLVEHAYPSQHKGWLVIATKRHVQSIHELTSEEFKEFGGVLERTAKVLANAIPCEKIYNVSLGEVPGFNHVHYHTIAVPHNLPPELRGTKIFELLKEPEKAIAREEIKRFCEYLKERF